jgi:hypothetical protein
MMPTQNSLVTKLLDTIVEHLDIPKSYYEKAVSRHKSLGEWLCRPESQVAAFQPHVSPQGSFRYGTVNRPLIASEEYDLDNVTTLAIAKTAMTQKQLKELYGAEIKGYARANVMLAPVEEKDRCWRLVYADEVSFHLDTLPCVPEQQAVILALTSRGVPPELAALAIAITDRRHPQYDQITPALLSSNPRGFAKWFETRARPVAEARMRQLVEGRFYASVEDVPPYEWKTPLQGSIQILKRHRDVMFGKNPGASPISMIITNLAAHAYAGEADLWSALSNIVEGMPQYVNPTRPRVPNPSDPAEDYADKWAKDPTLEGNFWAWHTQVKIDIARLPALLSGKSLGADVRGIFRVELSQDHLKQFEPREALATPVMVRSAPVVYVPTAPRPWGAGA